MRAFILPSILFSFFCGFINFNAKACSIFLANDGENVWVGNNEDGTSNINYRLWFYPSTKKQFAYVIWTELLKGNMKVFNGKMYLFPQGGLNEFGLFMDYTAIDKMDAEVKPNKKNTKKEVVTKLLQTCKTVEEALAYIQQYNLIKLTSAQLFIADASGDYVTVHANYIIRKERANFALTNYCINKNKHEACWRRDAANIALEKNNQEVNLSFIKNILKQTVQRSPNYYVTNYSMAIDLKSASIHLYNKTNFDQVVNIELKSSIGNKKYHKNVLDYFTPPIFNAVQMMIEKEGIQAGIDLYKTEFKTIKANYNFSIPCTMQWLGKWVFQKKASEVILFLEMMNHCHPNNTEILAYLALFLKKDNRNAESEEYFSEILKIDANHYLANLWSHQREQKVVFKLNAFHSAEKISVMGEFTNWREQAIPMKKVDGVWQLELSLNEGVHYYKFLVNDESTSDPNNALHQVIKGRICNVLEVW
jgi:hypothetical protein